MAKQSCERCGVTTGLQLFAEQLLCKKCREALPRRKCAAVVAYSGTRKSRGLKRCPQNAFGDDLLCAAHKKARAKAEQWEFCPHCSNVERIVGGECPRCHAKPQQI